MAGTLGATRFYACARHGARARHTRTHTARRGGSGSARAGGGAAAAASSGAASAGSRLSSSSGSGRERGGAGAAGGAAGAGEAGSPRAGARFRIWERSRRGCRSLCQRRPPARRSRASLPGGRFAAALPRPPLTPPSSPSRARPFLPGAELRARTAAPPRASRRRGPDPPPPPPPPAERPQPSAAPCGVRGGGGARGSAPASCRVGARRPLLARSLGGAPGRPVKDAIVAAERIGPRGGLSFPFCPGRTAPLPFVSRGRCPAQSAVRLRPG